MILKLTSTTGVTYVNFNKVSCWREWFEVSGHNTKGRGSIIIFDDADHFEIMVNETPDEINNLLKGTHAPAQQTTAGQEYDSAYNRAIRTGCGHIAAHRHACRQAAARYCPTCTGQGSGEGLLDRPLL